MKIIWIRPGGVEYVRVPLAGAPFDAGPVEISFDDDPTWHTAAWNDDKTMATLLVGGPAGTSSEPFVELALGTHEFNVRLVDAPETVIRQSDSVIEVR